MKKMDFDKLDEVDFEIEKEAFSPKELYCCNKKMKKTEMEIQIDKYIYIKLKGFECDKCRKNYLGLDESKKLDNALILSRTVNKDFKITRKLSFDGDNYIFRIPKEFTQGVNKRKVEIIPLGSKEFCAVVE